MAKAKAMARATAKDGTRDLSQDPKPGPGSKAGTQSRNQGAKPGPKAGTRDQSRDPGPKPPCSHLRWRLFLLTFPAFVFYPSLAIIILYYIILHHPGRPLRNCVLECDYEEDPLRRYVRCKVYRDFVCPGLLPKVLVSIIFIDLLRLFKCWLIWRKTSRCHLLSQCTGCTVLYSVYARVLTSLLTLVTCCNCGHGVRLTAADGEIIPDLFVFSIELGPEGSKAIAEVMPRCPRLQTEFENRVCVCFLGAR